MSVHKNFQKIFNQFTHLQTKYDSYAKVIHENFEWIPEDKYSLINSKN